MRKKVLKADLSVPEIVSNFRLGKVSKKEIESIKLLLKKYEGLPLRERAKKISKEWDYRKPNGEFSFKSCENILLELSRRGLISLPTRRINNNINRYKYSLNEKEQKKIENREITSLDFSKIKVRPIYSKEANLWRSYCFQYHYLGFKTMVGERILYVAEAEGEWLALLGWGAAAIGIGARDREIGWSESKKWERIRYIVNNVRYLILPGVKVYNLASHILSKNLNRLSQDWENRYHHPVYLAETFVDSEYYRGTCYMANNWRCLGDTLGYSRTGKQYKYHGKKKKIFIYPLHRRYKEILGGEKMPTKAPHKKPDIYLNISRLPIEELVSAFSEIRDHRYARGVRHSLSSVLSLVACAIISGAKSYEGIADWTMEIPAQKLILFNINRSKGPSETCIRRIMQKTNFNIFRNISEEWFKKIEDRNLLLEKNALEKVKTSFQRLSYLFHS